MIILQSIIIMKSHVCNSGSLLIQGVVKGVVLLLQSINLVDNINLLECPIPALSVLCLSQKIRVTSLLTVFLKHGQMDFSKASNSISHHLTSIFSEKCQIFRFFGWVGGV